jgi:hypothetical protein
MQVMKLFYPIDHIVKIVKKINQEFISELKGYWLCDLVVRDKNSENPKLLFLREISDAMILKN